MLALPLALGLLGGYVIGQRHPRLEGLATREPHRRPSRRQLRKGTRVELEHTRDEQLARTIARDHLAEHPDYYSRLVKAGL